MKGIYQKLMEVQRCLKAPKGQYYVHALARFIDIESGEEITSTAYAREEEQKKGMDGSQITGASSSYARKYALNGLFCIDGNKDSDSTHTGPETAPNGCQQAI